MLLPGKSYDFGYLDVQCPWCLVRAGGGRTLAPEWIAARLHYEVGDVPDYLRRYAQRLGPRLRGFDDAYTAMVERPEWHDALGGEAPDVSIMDEDIAREREALSAPVASVSQGPARDSEEPASFAHHAHDLRWIEGQLIGRSVAEADRLRRRYGDVYQSAYDAEPIDVRKEGTARRAANQWLLEESSR